MDPVKNFARVIVSTGYNASAVTIALALGEGVKLPDPATLGAYDVVWWNAEDYADAAEDPNREFVRITAISADTLTIIRAQQGTPASAHNVAGKTHKMELVLSKKIWDELVAQIPTRADDVLDGTTSYKRVTIAGVTAGSDAIAVWGNNNQADPAVNYSPPIGAVYVSEVGAGYVDVRSTADEVRDRRVKVWVVK